VNYFDLDRSYLHLQGNQDTISKKLSLYAIINA